MESCTKKTTILFPPKMYRQLKRLAEQRGTSVAHMVREAAIRCYLIPNPRTRRDAAEAIAAMSLPVSDWSQMEREIAEGRLRHP